MTLIGEAVFSRCLSAIKAERVAASAILPGPERPAAPDREAAIEDIRRALYCSKIISYAQGYMLLREAAKDQGWNLNFGGIALMWRGGCIIRSRFLGKIKEAFDKNPSLGNLLLDDFFSKLLIDYQASWRRAVVQAIQYGVPDAGLRHGAGFLRRLPHGAPARQPAASPARFLRRAHLRARGQAARPILPHQLDWARRQGGLGYL